MTTTQPILRNKTRVLTLGTLKVGGGNPISVQSMLKTSLTDSEKACEQAETLIKCGCEVIRVALPDEKSIPGLSELLRISTVPIVADIHFDYRLALSAVDAGVHGLRINPGNIGSKGRIKAVVSAAKQNNIPIRIGVNAGSLEKDLLIKHGAPTAAAMVESGLRHIRLLEAEGFEDIKISLKASSVAKTVEAYRAMACEVNYPLHLGITEAGPPGIGTIKSSVGLGILLYEGLGDTIRVSLTGPPEEEVTVGFEILKSLGLREFGPHLVSCPTCGRCQIDIFSLVHEVQAVLKDIETPLTVAVMGCVVNGPGEAKEADIGIAGGKDYALLFKKGKAIHKIPQDQLSAVLRKELIDFETGK